jgi:hypothetical protein
VDDLGNTMASFTVARLDPSGLDLSNLNPSGLDLCRGSSMVWSARSTYSNTVDATSKG